MSKASPQKSPIYYTRLSDFKVGMLVDNLAVGECKVVEVRPEKERMPLSNGQRCGYSCRGWITVEYIGCQLDGSNEQMYQRCDPIVGISETDIPYKYTFDPFFRETGFDDVPWPRPVDNIFLIDRVRPEEVCGSGHWEGTKYFKGKPKAEHIDPRNGRPLCWDCYEELIMTEIYIVYYGPQGRNLGAFPSEEAANSFIDAWLMHWRLDDREKERREFEVSGLVFNPNPADCEL